jgi:preprotein translocase subunit SecB
MKHSQLQLLRYIAPALSCSANPTFNPGKPHESGFEQFSVNAVVARQKAPDNFPGHAWSIEMTISQKLKEGQNFPCKYEVCLIGFFACKDGFPSAEAEDHFVRVNGSSILYGVARELIRYLTDSGPWGAIIIPTVSFYEIETPPKEAAIEAPSPS